jgi:hypothetical protein
MDHRPFPLASRVVLPLAVLLGLVWSGSSAPPRTTAAPPAQAAVRAAMEAPGGIVGGDGQPVVTAGRLAQRNRRPSGSPAVLAAAVVAAIVVAVRPRSRPAGARRLVRRLSDLRPRAPPCRRPVT